jgi:hypothetical protein
MTDYNLSALSPRSFELLLQAIARKVIGSRFTIFGREAVFEGMTSYPSPDKAWNGRIVLQTKFRLPTDDTRNDNDWVLQQLRLELDSSILALH